MFDVDHFKNYNDNNGHLKGSEALRQVGDIMRRCFRSSDVLAKYVEEEPFEGRQQQPLGKVTLSLGISSYPEHGTTVEELLDHADKALYYAKKDGRNRTVLYSEDLEEED
jgi:GGDEF domain-containing protein